MVSASPARQRDTYALVIGDGIIGLSTAYALGRAGADCIVVGARNAGMASVAAAGLLLPHFDELPSSIQPFYRASMEAYPAFLEQLREYDTSLKYIHGVTETSMPSGGAARSRASDGAVDNVRLVAAVRAAVADQPTVELIDDEAVVHIGFEADACSATTRAGTRIAAQRIVLAAGAWTPHIAGLPRAVPVRPLKGQMLALAADPLIQPLIADDVYLVPRGRETLVGATVEEAGFDLSIDEAAIERLRTAAVTACPALSDASITRRWAGTRPATPDMFPILGAEPDEPRLFYACGHSKNGIMLAPATASAISALVLETPSALDLTPFFVTRFSGIK